MKKMITYLLLGFVASISLAFVIGWVLPKEKTFTKTAELKSQTKTVFDLVTDVGNQATWRNDVKEVKVLDDSTWTEIPKSGNPITFKIKQKIENELFEIEIIAPQNFNGTWRGTFKPNSQNGTSIVFTETIVVTNPLIRTFSYFFIDLNKVMDIYIENLKKKLGE